MEFVRHRKGWKGDGKCKTSRRDDNSSVRLTVYVSDTAQLGRYTLQWRHNELYGVLNHRRLHCLLNCWFRRRSKKTSKFRVTGLCVGNSPVTGEFPAQKASNAVNVSIWWRHHDSFHTSNENGTCHLTATIEITILASYYIVSLSSHRQSEMPTADIYWNPISKLV